MKITIHISHTDTDNLSALQAKARLLGCEVTERGGFMGRHHTEIVTDMTPAAVEQMLQDAIGQASAAA